MPLFFGATEETVGREPSVKEMIDIEVARKGDIAEGALHGLTVMPFCWFVEQPPALCCVKPTGFLLVGSLMINF